MNDLLVLAQLPDEFLNPVLVKKRLLPGRFDAFVHQVDLQPGVQERQFAQSARETLKLELSRDREDRRIRKERDQRAGHFLVLQLADDA